MNRELDRVAAVLRGASGIRLEPSQYPGLRAALARVLPGGDAAAFLRAAQYPVAGAETVARLIDAVTVQESSFFRDRRQLDAVDWPLLLDRARAAGSDRIRVWSAACASGEEPYTLALMAAEAFAPAPPPVHVLGTDISATALEGARAAAYRERSLRAVEPGLRVRWFREEDGLFSLEDGSRRLVRFERHNLARDPIPPAGEERFDLIVCRNVLIYLDGETVERVIGALELALRPGGMLILGSADTLCGTVQRLARLGEREAPSPGPAPPPARARRRAAGAVRRRGLVPAGPRRPPGGRGVHGGRLAPAALYVDQSFALAAFTLGRAHEAAGDGGSARRAYEQALRTVALADGRYDHLLERAGLGDVTAACRARLAALGPATTMRAR